MEADELQTIYAMVEESSKTNESVGQFVDEGVRSPAIIFRHKSGCSAQPGFHCDCLFARMNFNEMSALDAATQSGLQGLNSTPTLHIKLSEQENHLFCNVASFFGIFTGARTGRQTTPKPKSALRMMTTGDETGRCFWGPNGIWTKFLASARTAITELRALVARQAAAILRLLSHLANLGGGGAAPMAIAADLPGGAPPALNLPPLPAAPAKPPPCAKPPPAPAAQAVRHQVSTARFAAGLRPPASRTAACC